jgi:hypothetical protein
MRFLALFGFLLSGNEMVAYPVPAIKPQDAQAARHSTHAAAPARSRALHFDFRHFRGAHEREHSIQRHDLWIPGLSFGPPGMTNRLSYPPSARQ